jgi:glycosyltransferase involved in cell wall biosynthesis
MGKMRIVFVSFQYCRENLRLLPWKYVNEFSKQFKKLGHSVVIITDGYPNLPRIDLIDDIPIIHLAHVKHFPPKGFKSIVAAISEIDPDIVFWQMGLTNFFQKKLFNIIDYPIVSFLGSSIYWRHEIIERIGISEIWKERNLITNLVETFFPRLFVRSSLNSAAIKLVVATSQENAKRLKKIGVLPEKIVHIPVGGDPYFLEDPPQKTIIAARSEVCGNEQKVVITYFGPPLLTRGVDTFLKSLNYICCSFPGLENRLKVLFLFRIRKDEKYSGEKIVNKFFDQFSHSEIIKIRKGFLSGNEIKSYIAASDLIVLPFKHVISDFPLAVVEAMSMGKLVISTRVDGITELLEPDRGILIDPGDYINLAKVIARLLEDMPSVKDYGRRAKSYISKSPTWESSSKKMLDLISTMIKSRNST